MEHITTINFSVLIFYPRPVLAFGYCRCLRLSVCVSVCVCINHVLVRAITHHPFKLGSPNLDHRCKRPWLRFVLFWGAIDLDLQGQIELQSQNLPHFELVHAITAPWHRLFHSVNVSWWDHSECATGRRPFGLGVVMGLGGLAYLLFCAAYWSRLPRVFRHLSCSCFVMLKWILHEWSVLWMSSICSF